MTADEQKAEDKHLLEGLQTASNNLGESTSWMQMKQNAGEIDFAEFEEWFRSACKQAYLGSSRRKLAA